MKRTYQLVGRLVAFLFLFSPILLHAANPVGEQVISGDVSFDRSAPGVLTIGQGSDRAIINWEDFSIGAGSLTRFIQPGAGSAALNRVVGGNPSSIYGQLQANGQIFLINPAGVLVGASGQIDTKGLVASTLDLSNESFLEGARMTLSGGSEASVRNLGRISASQGDVYLIARTVENAGSISASIGTVGLGGGSEVVLVDGGGIAVIAGNGTVANSGSVDAASAELKAANGNIYALAINNTGVVRAGSLVNQGGKIVLQADGATALSSGSLVANGGEVQVLGAQVGLDGSIDVSGVNGGTALVGGGFQGNAAGVLNAQRTVVGSGATINANGASGNGGNVVVWADNFTSYSGSISARGGSVEVSGKESLAFNGAVDAGADGSILLDPRDLTIVSTGANDSDLSVSGILAAAPNATSDVTISASAIEALTGAVTLEASRDLTINAALSFTQSSGTMTFNAGDDLTIAAAVNTAGAALSFNASTGGLNTGTAKLTVAGPTSGGNVTFNNAGGSGGIILSASVPNAGKDVTFSSKTKVSADVSVTGADITFESTLDGSAANTQQLTVTPSGTALFSGAIGATAFKALTLDGVGEAELGAGTVKALTMTFKTPVLLSKNTTLTGTDVFFDSTLNAKTGNNSTLTVTASNNTVFGGAVGTTGATITSLTTDVAGKTTVKGGSINATSIKIADPLTLAGDTVLTGNATLGTVDADLAANNRTLSIVSSGTSTLGGDVGATQRLGSITADATGSTVIKGAAINATTQTYNDSVTVGVDSTLTGTTVTFGGTASGSGKNLTINASGATTFGDKVGSSGAFLLLETDSAGTTAVNGTVVAAKTLKLNDPVTIGANVAITAATQANVLNTLNGDIADTRELTINSPDTQIGAAGVIGGTGILKAITTDAAGSTVVTATALKATTQTFKDQLGLAANLTLTGTTISLEKGAKNQTAATQKDLTVNASLASTIGGTVGTTTVGDGLLSLTTDAPGTTTIKATSVNAVTQAYNDKVVVSGSVTLGGYATTGSSDAVTFKKAVDGVAANSGNLTLKTVGGATFDSTIGSSKALGTLTVDSTVASTTIKGGTVNARTQVYDGAVTLNASTTLAGTTVTIANASFQPDANTRTLYVDASGVTSFSADLTGTSFNTITTSATGSTVIGGNITTVNAQTYADDVVLGSSDSAVSTYTLTSSGNADITFSKKINSGTTTGQRTLSVVTDGVTRFNGDIGTSKVLTGLITDAGGSTRIDAASVKAIDQTYGDAVVLVKTTGTTTLTADDGAAGGDVTFSSTLDGNTSDTASLTIVADGTTTFSGAVGATTGLKALITDKQSTDVTKLNAATVKAVTQTYNDAVTFNSSTFDTSTLTGATVTFGSLVDAEVGSASEKVIINASGETTFGGNVGDTTDLLSLTTDLAGSTVIKGTSIDAATQTYNDAVTINGPSSATVVLSGSTAVKFANTLNSNKTTDSTNLTLDGAGTTTFEGVVGGTGQFAALSAAAGPVVINTTAITTSGAQTYAAAGTAITIGSTSTLTGTDINLAGVVNADAAANARALTVNASGTTTLGGNVGATTKLGRLTTDSAGTLTLSSVTSNVNATTVTFNDAVTLGTGTTVTGADINLNAAVTAGANTLTLNGSGTTAINAAITGTGAIVTDAAGTTRIGADVSNTGAAQTYNDAVLIAANTTLSGTIITFADTLNADLALNDRVLTIVDAGDTVFTGKVGYSDPLGTLNVTAGTQINVDGGSVDAKTQTYNQPVEIGANTVIKATDVTFTGAVSAAVAQNLTISATGTTTLTAGLTADSITDLTIDNGGSVSLGGSVSTKGNQVFEDSVTLGNATVTLATAAGKDITLNGAVTGGGNALVLNTTGNTIINGAISGVSTLNTDAAGATKIGANITTTGVQTFADEITLTDDVVFNTTGAGFVASDADAAISGGTSSYSLTINSAADPQIGGTASQIDGADLLSIGNLTVTPASSITGTITTTGKQTYTGATTLIAASSLVGTDITLTGGATAAGFSLTLAGSGVTKIDGAITAAAGNVVSNGGGVTLLNANVTSSGAGAITFTDTVVLGSDVTLTTGAVGGIITLSGVAGNSHALKLDSADTSAAAVDLKGAISGLTTFEAGTGAAGKIEINANVSSSGTQTYNDAVLLAGGTTITLTGTTIITTANIGTTASENLTIVGNANFAEVGSGIAVGVLSVSGATTLNANVSTVDNQTYTGAVTVAAASTITGTGDITFGSTITSAASDLKVDGDGNKYFQGAITLGAGDLTVVDDSTETVLYADATAATLTFGEVLVLEGDVTLTGTLTATGGIDGLLSEKNSLVLVTASPTVGATTGSLDVTMVDNVGDLTVTGASTLIGSGEMSTTGFQTYTGAVSLGAAPTLTSTGTGAAGNITFSSTINGAADVSINTAGTTALTGIVGGTTGLTSLTTDSAGATTLNANVSATTITLNDAVTLATGAITLTGNTTAASTVNGGQVLTVTGTGHFGAEVGGTTALTSLAVSSTSTLSGDVTTTAAQTFTGLVTLAGDVVLTAPTSLVATAGINGSASNYDLNIPSTALTIGATGGSVNGTLLDSLGDLTLGGASTLIGGTLTTTGAQTYTGAVKIGASTVLTGTDVTFSSTVNGSTANTEDLTINASGATTFSGVVGATTLQDLATDSAGTTVIGANITTGTSITIADPLTLTGAATRTLASTTVTLAAVNAASAGETSLAVTGTAVFGGVIGGTTAPGAVSVSGPSSIGGNVTTSTSNSGTGNQTYTGDSTLTAASTLKAPGALVALSFAGGNDLTIDSASPQIGATASSVDPKDIANAVTNLRFKDTVKFYSSDATALNNTGTQTYDAAITLAAGTSAVTLGGGNTTSITTGSAATITGTGTDDLIIASAATLGGDITLGGDLTITPASTLPANVTTGLTQTYTAAPTLAANTVLTGTTLTLGAALVGASKDLTLDFSGSPTINLANITAVKNFTVSKAATLNNDLSTTGTQTYSGAITIGGAASTVTLTSSGTGTAGDITFKGIVNGTGAGAETLEVDTAGTTWFQKAVGGTTTLHTLLTDSSGTGAGTTKLGSSVTTATAQTYNDSVVLTSSVVLGGAGAITLNAVNGGANNLTLSSSGLTTLKDSISDVVTLTSDNGGNTVFGVSGGSDTITITSTSSQTYVDNIVVEEETILTGTPVTLLGTTTINGGSLTTP